MCGCDKDWKMNCWQHAVNFAEYAPITKMRKHRTATIEVIRKDTHFTANTKYIYAQLTIMLNIAVSAPNSPQTFLLDNMTLKMTQKVHSSEPDFLHTGKNTEQTNM